jgi:hypothetical protein
MGWVSQATQKVSNAATKAVAPVAKAVTAVTQPVEKAVTAGVADTSKNLTSALQPVEKVVTAVSQDPKALAAIAIAVAAPYASAQIAAYLTTAGLSEAAAAVAADAITSITIQTAQGVPIEKATENALTNLAISGVNNQVAKQVGTVISKPEIASAISSTVTSGLTTAAKGGSQADVEKAMTAGLVSSAASTAYKQAVDSSSTVASKAVGGAAGGAVTGGTEGAVVGGLSSTAGALGSDLAADLKAKNKAAADTAALPPDQVAALGGAVSPDTTSQSDVDTGQTSIEIPPAPVAGLDLTKDQQILDLIAEKPAVTDVAAVGDVPATPDKTPITAPPVVVEADIPRVEVSGVGNIEPPQGAYLPDTVPAESTAIEPAPVAEGYSTSMPDESAAETARLAAKEQQILDLITPAPVAEEPKQGAFLPDTAPTPEAPDIPAADPMSQDPAQQAQAAADVPAVEVAPSTGTGLIDTPPVSDTDKQILDLISEEPTEDQSDAETERLARKEAELAGAEKGAYLPDSGTDTKTTTYKPNLFTTTYLSPKTRTAAAPTSALGSALGTTGLTSYRGAGEIEGAGSGKPRKKVWNEESLKLKDALGV